MDENSRNNYSHPSDLMSILACMGRREEKKEEKKDIDTSSYRLVSSCSLLKNLTVSKLSNESNARADALFSNAFIVLRNWVLWQPFHSI
jgi:hypothetical protein